MATVLNIGLDLGGDTIKVAFAYQNQKNKFFYGKLMKDDVLTQVALPAIAYYDQYLQQWVYGDDVDKVSDQSFITVVKIKALLSLLLEHKAQLKDTNAYPFEANETEEQRQKRLTEETKLNNARNREYFYNNNHFPKFYFPVRRQMQRDYNAMVQKGMTFQAIGTPQTVCEGFFAYVRDIIEQCIVNLSKQTGVEFSKFNIAVVHPSRTGKAYVTELESLVKKVFGDKPHKILSTTKALCMYAWHRGNVNTDEQILAFDLGEESISCAKATLDDENNFMIDGADGHNSPLNVGGNNIDDAVSNYIETGIQQRETVGTSSYGSDGHIEERGLLSKQYLFSRDIKEAKMAFGLDYYNEIFPNGVPIGIHRDLFIQRNLNPKEFLECTGIAQNNGVARRIYDYIDQELSRDNNAHVKKVFLSGGLLETYSLLDYLTKLIETNHKGVKVFTFENIQSDVPDSFKIGQIEDSTYAPAVGAAVVSARNLPVDTVVSVSYGTFTGVTQREHYGSIFLDLFLSRGMPLPAERKFYISDEDGYGIGHEAAKDNYNRVSGPGEPCSESPEALLLTFAGQRDIDKKKYFPASAVRDLGQVTIVRSANGTEKAYVNLGKGRNGPDPNAPQYKNAETYIGLRSITGKLTFEYKGKPIVLREQLQIVEGIWVDEEGSVTFDAMPSKKWYSNKNHKTTIMISYVGARNKSEYITVNALDIVVKNDLKQLQVEAGD